MFVEVIGRQLQRSRKATQQRAPERKRLLIIRRHRRAERRHLARPHVGPEQAAGGAVVTVRQVPREIEGFLRVLALAVEDLFAGRNVAAVVVGLADVVLELRGGREGEEIARDLLEPRDELGGHSVPGDVQEADLRGRAAQGLHRVIEACRVVLDEGAHVHDGQGLKRVDGAGVRHRWLGFGDRASRKPPRRRALGRLCRAR
jgi:hypothetical protein